MNLSDYLFTPLNDDCSLPEDISYLDPENTENSREMISWWFLGQIEQYGITVEYQQNNYSLSSHNPIYGENPTKIFSDPIDVKMYVVFNSDSIVLNQFGIESDGDITCFIHLSSFAENFGEDSEPLGGDLIRLKDYGDTNRPNGRGAPIFEITHRDDEDLTLINPLMGHYVWLVRGRRYDYSFENNVTPETKMNQVNDDEAQPSALSGTPTLSSVSENIYKTYTDETDEIASLIFDYNDVPESNDSIYGDY